MKSGLPNSFAITCGSLQMRRPVAASPPELALCARQLADLRPSYSAFAGST
jgi:hypothetical protein